MSTVEMVTTQSAIITASAETNGSSFGSISRHPAPTRIRNWIKWPKTADLCVRSRAWVTKPECPGAESGLPSHVVMLYVVKGNPLVTVGLSGFDDEVGGEKAKSVAQ